MKPFVAAVAVACAVAGAVLAAHHPLGGAAALLLFSGWTVAAFLAPSAWLVVVPALLPVLALAPWSGWLAIEELDLLVLGAAAGGYARSAFAARDASASRAAGAAPRVPPLAALLIGLFSVSLAISTVIGVRAAGGFHLDAYEGYREPLNGLRQAKPLALVLLLLPLWRTAARLDVAAARRWLGTGIVAGLAAASLAAVWERLAFTGLLDFTADYRTTALFWEMHIGGAAFDGFLALTVPFAVLELQAAASRARFAAVWLVLALAAYACLTTFSRGVYLAVPIAVVVTWWLAARQHGLGAVTQSGGARRLLGAGATLLFFGVAAAWTFPSSGYRGMLALLGAFALLLRLAGARTALDRNGWLLAAIGAVGAFAVVAAMAMLPKGFYIAYAALFLLALAVSLGLPARRGLLPGLYLGLLAAAAGVAWHWGGDVALRRMMPVLAVLAVGGAVAALSRPAARTSARWQAAFMIALGLVSGLLGVAGGGAYMGDRFTTSSRDLDTRIAHWRDGISMLRTPFDWALGQGLGRYPAMYALAHAEDDGPGDYRRIADENGPRLALTGGHHPLGWSGLLRVSQRIVPPSLPATVRFRVRSDQHVLLHVDICEKHLLYDAGCVTTEWKAEPTKGAWRDGELTLPSGFVTRGRWYAPRIVVFSVANGDTDNRFELAGLSLRGADGAELLTNGDFANGLSHWFFSSDRYHLPWHLKDAAVHTLFHQGLFGLATLAALLVGALWRLSFGWARSHPLAPAIAGSLIGFGVVGLFDSLLDVPRVDFLFYLLLLIGLTDRTVSTTAAAVNAAPTASNPMPAP